MFPREGAAQAFQRFNMSVAKLTFDLWMGAASAFLEATMKAPVRGLSFGRALAQVMAPEAERERGPVTSARAPQLAEAGPMEAVLTELNAIDRKVADLAQRVERQAREGAAAASARSLDLASKADVELLKADLKTLEATLAQFTRSVDLKKLVAQSDEFKRHVAGAFTEFFHQANIATKADVDILLTAWNTMWNTLDGKLNQLTSSVGGFASNLGKAVEKVTVSYEVMSNSLASLQHAVESQTNSMLTELKVSHSRLTQTVDSINDVLGRLTSIERKVNQVMERSSPA